MELSLIKPKETAVAEFSFDGIRKIYAEILAAQEEVGGTVTYRAKVATGGGKSFDIDTGNEDTDTSTPKLTGVIIHSHKCNARFDESTTGEPPVCSSMDGIVGTNTETGEMHSCKDCPYNQYGSSAKGSGKACKNMIRLYMIVEGSPIPLVISLPPTSLKPWQNYRLGVLAPLKFKPVEVVTELTLTPQVSKSGNKYSMVKPRLIGKLGEGAAETAKFFTSGFVPKVEITADDYNKSDDKETANA